MTETDCSSESHGGYAPEWYVPGVQYFAWEPRGRRIAYFATCASVTYQYAHLNIIDLETNQTISIPNETDNTSYLSWAPDGRRLVFARNAGGLRIVDLGQNKPKIEFVPGSTLGECLPGCFKATWSPTGNYIAYQGPFVALPGVGSGRTYVSIVDLDGNHIIYEPESTHRSNWMFQPQRGGLAWSNDGHYLAIATARSYTGAQLTLGKVTGRKIVRAKFGLWQGSTDRPNQFGPGFYNPVFSPDDETLYFVSLWPEATDIRQPFGTIYSVSTQELFDDSSPNVHAVSSKDQLTGYPSLSPDGKWLVYAVQTSKGVELWLQEVEGSFRQKLVDDTFVNIQPAWRPTPSD